MNEQNRDEQKEDFAAIFEEQLEIIQANHPDWLPDQQREHAHIKTSMLLLNPSLRKSGGFVRTDLLTLPKPVTEMLGDLISPESPIDNRESLIAGRYDEFVKKYPQMAPELVEHFSKTASVIENTVKGAQDLHDDIRKIRLVKRSALDELYKAMNKHLAEAKRLCNGSLHKEIATDTHEKMIKNKLHQYLETQIRCEVLEREIEELDEQEWDLQKALAEHDLKLRQGKWLIDELKGSINRINGEGSSETDEIARRQPPFPMYAIEPANQVALRNARVDELFAKLPGLWPGVR